MADITLYVLSGLSKPFAELWVDRSSTIHASNFFATQDVKIPSGSMFTYAKPS